MWKGCNTGIFFFCKCNILLVRLHHFSSLIFAQPYANSPILLSDWVPFSPPTPPSPQYSHSPPPTLPIPPPIRNLIHHTARQFRWRKSVTVGAFQFARVFSWVFFKKERKQLWAVRFLKQQITGCHLMQNANNSRVSACDWLGCLEAKGLLFALHHREDFGTHLAAVFLTEDFAGIVLS